MEKPRKYTPVPGLSKTQQTKRRRRKYPNVFFKKEIVTLFDAIDNVRTIMGAFLAFFCALRISEVCRLKWNEIDLQEARLKVIDGKNHKDGFIPISPLALPVLRKWRAMNPKEEYFLPTDRYKTGYYQPTSLLKDYIRFLEKANLRIVTELNAGGRQQHQYKFHTLRHSRCTHLLSNSVPVEKVQKFMRHDDLETTMGYTWILDKEMNKAVIEADIGTYDVQATRPQGIATVTPLTASEIAQKRLATG
ncbi:MAG: tyrosine-type recombinase/integrase, partial [Nanoarchaeota archaeon]